MASLLSFKRKQKETTTELEMLRMTHLLGAMENQRVSSPISWGQDSFVGLGDSANARGELDALRGAINTALRVIRERIAGLELGVFTRRFVNGDFEDTPAFNHPLMRLLENPTLDAATGTITHSAMQLYGAIVTQYKAVGEAYLVIVHDGMGVPTNLQLAQPGTIQPYVTGGRIVGYKLLATGSSQAQGELRPQDVIRIWNPDPYDMYTAQGVMARNATLVNMDQHANQHWAQFYRNDATPKLAFEARETSESFPTQDQQEAVSSSWLKQMHRILGRRKGAPAWVKPGWTVKELSSQNEAVNGVAMMKHTRSIAFETLGVPTSLVGDVVDVNRAAAETTRFTFDTNTIEPITQAIAEALTMQLASQYPQPSEDVRLIVKYRPFIPRDKAFDLMQDETDLRLKVRTVNEVRAFREPELPSASWGDLPVGTMGEVPYTGEEQDIDLSAFTLPPADDDETEPVAPDEDEAEEADADETPRSRVYGKLSQIRAHYSKEREWERMLARDAQWTPKFRTMQRSLLKRQGEITLERYSDLVIKGGRSLQRAEGDDLAEELFPLNGWARLFEVTTEPVRLAAFVDSGSAVTDAITGTRFSMTDSAVKLINEQSGAHYVFTNRTTQEQLAKTLSRGISDGESVDQIAARISELFGNRRASATRIARTEIATAVTTAQEEGYEQTGVVEGKQWHTSLDMDVRDSHQIDSQTRKLGEDFTLSNGQSASGPAALDLPPGDRINCRCFTTPVFFDETAASIGMLAPQG